jgi:hypothetical protein
MVVLFSVAGTFIEKKLSDGNISIQSRPEYRGPTTSILSIYRCSIREKNGDDFTTVVEAGPVQRGPVLTVSDIRIFFTRKQF